MSYFNRWRYHFLILLLAFMSYKTANTTMHQNLSLLNKRNSNVENCSEKKSFLKVLTWNVYMLPYLHYFHNTRTRAMEIGEQLRNSDYDVIVFQETFHTPSRAILKEKLRAGYQFFYGPFNDPGISVLTNSGLFVASRIPLLLSGVIEFNQKASFDALARKGAVLLEGSKNGHSFQIITTHMQADQSAVYQEIRKNQMRQIFMELMIPFSKAGVPQLICGDLNINSDDSQACKAIQEVMFTSEPEFGNAIPTYDEYGNTIARDAEPYARTLDYILVSNTQHEKVIQNTVVIKGGYGKESHFLSDHHAVEATIPLHQFSK